MHIYKLVDGVVINGELTKALVIKNLSETESKDIGLLVDKQYSVLESKNDFYVVNEKHGDSIKGLIYLNEHTAASIVQIGGTPVELTFFDICEMKMTAQDWQIVLCASIAVEEYYHRTDGEMLA
ncbi:hypothetical protein ACRN91_14305 [Shewanella baltica]|uniref:hypothetical protein n=1 Tax=Shewanella baltica TaxID=62322 RepID=UPI003D7B2435